MKTMIIIILILIVALTFCLWLITRMSKEEKEAEKEHKRTRENLEYLLKHSEQLSDIQKNNITINKAIENAESEEDINNIVAAIIDSNNNRV